MRKLGVDFTHDNARPQVLKDEGARDQANEFSRAIDDRRVSRMKIVASVVGHLVAARHGHPVAPAVEDRIFAEHHQGGSLHIGFQDARIIEVALEWRSM